MLPEERVLSIKKPTSQGLQLRTTRPYLDLLSPVTRINSVGSHGMQPQNAPDRHQLVLQASVHLKDFCEALISGDSRPSPREPYLWNRLMVGLLI